MRQLMVVVVLRAPQLPRELGGRPERHPATEVLAVGRVAALDRAIDLRSTRGTAGDAKIRERPREIGAELVPLVGLDALNRRGNR
jgi:hypothetical protein